jgi:hypothetical protein
MRRFLFSIFAGMLSLLFRLSLHSTIFSKTWMPALEHRGHIRLQRCQNHRRPETSSIS